MSHGSEGGILDEVPPPYPEPAAVPVRECGERLVDLRDVPALRTATPGSVLLRLGVVDRLVTAQTMLPEGLRLLVLGAHRPSPGLRCTGHETGAAADLTLCRADGVELWPGATDPVAAEQRHTLSEALSVAGLSNYPAAWWHWSHGDCSWAYLRGAGHARYGPVRR